MSEERKIYLSVGDKEWLQRKKDLQDKLSALIYALEGPASYADLVGILVEGGVKDGLLTEDEAVAWRGKCIRASCNTETYYREAYNNPKKAPVMVFEHPNDSWVPGWAWLVVVVIIMAALFLWLYK